MPTLVSDLISRTKEDLYGTYRGQYNKLNATLNTGDTSLTAQFPLGGMTDGSIIGIDDELLMVWATQGDALTASPLQRGWLGTTPVTHTAGSLIEVQPRFPTTMVRSALIDEINSWPNGLYSVDTIDFNVSAWQRAIDLSGFDGSTGAGKGNPKTVPTNFLRVLEVLRAPQAGLDSWTQVKYRLQRNMDPVEFPSTMALFLNRIIWNQLTWPQFSSAFTMRMTYARPFDTSTFTDGTDVVATVGLNQDMLDIPRLGAAWRLTAPREVARETIAAQGIAREAKDIPAGSTMRTGIQLEGLRNERIRQEVERLLIRYGWRNNNL